MKRLARSLLAVSAMLLALPMIGPTAPSSAAENTATTSIAVDDVTSIEMHVTANCVKADNQCYVTTAANLRTSQGPIPFPDNVWARQNTTVRSTNRLVYVADSDFDAANTRMFKSIDDVEFATVYLGGGPPEKFMMHANTHTVDWSTGQPRTDAGYIACAFIQVVYGGVNLTTPTACAQTMYS
ncbi:MAG: hypothetical protein ABW001_13580 [Mycobacterium sp.]